MEFTKIYRKLFILLIITYVFVYSENVPGTQTCLFEVTDCNYTLSLLPGPSCHGNRNDIHLRSKRSGETKPPAQSELLGKKIKRVQNKLMREMQRLSTRMLRGVRRVEMAVMDLVSKETDSGVVGTSTKKGCPVGFVTVEKWRSCYLLSHFNTSWYEAKDYCTALDSHVVSFLTLKEHYIVTYLIRNNLEVQHAEGWWTSGMFYPKTQQWMWASDTDLRPLTFIKWGTDEPNELSLQCIRLNTRDEYLWHDEVCTKSFNFVCKVDL